MARTFSPEIDLRDISTRSTNDNVRSERVGLVSERVGIGTCQPHIDASLRG